MARSSAWSSAPPDGGGRDKPFFHQRTGGQNCPLVFSGPGSPAQRVVFVTLHGSSAILADFLRIPLSLLHSLSSFLSLSPRPTMRIAQYISIVLPFFWYLFPLTFRKKSTIIAKVSGRGQTPCNISVSSPICNKSFILPEFTRVSFLLFRGVTDIKSFHYYSPRKPFGSRPKGFFGAGNGWPWQIK